MSSIWWVWLLLETIAAAEARACLHPDEEMTIRRARTPIPILPPSFSIWYEGTEGINEIYDYFIIFCRMCSKRRGAVGVRNASVNRRLIFSHISINIYFVTIKTHKLEFRFSEFLFVSRILPLFHSIMFQWTVSFAHWTARLWFAVTSRPKYVHIESGKFPRWLIRNLFFAFTAYLLWIILRLQRTIENI